MSKRLIADQSHHRGLELEHEEIRDLSLEYSKANIQNSLS
jgi:hypothetical protein